MTDGTTVQVTSSEYVEGEDYFEFTQVFRIATDERRELHLHVPPPDSDPERVPMVVAKVPRRSVVRVSSGMAA